MNIENVNNNLNESRAAIRNKMRQIQVEVARKEDFGVNDNTFIVNTHLGEILNFNDTVLGYDLEQQCISDLDEHEKIDSRMQSVVLVRKTYPRYRKRQRNRMWKLKHFDDLKKDDIDMVDDDEEEVKEQAKQSKKQKKKEQKKDQNKDYQLFL